MFKISDWIYLKDSKIVWKTVTIMVWVHGNELSWVQVLDEILKNIEIDFWKVYFIYANLKATQINTRKFEKDLNRCFLKWNNWETYEDKRAREIMKYLEKSDYLLDIHNTTNKENSIPFLISENNYFWKYFNVDLIVKWFDKLHPGWSDYYMNSIWKVWLCLESGSIYDSMWSKIAKEWILNFLKFSWNINGKVKIYENKKYIKFKEIYKNKTLDFKFSKNYKDFEEIKKWEIIAFDWWKEILANFEWFILFPNLPKNIWDECFCLGRID